MRWAGSCVLAAAGLILAGCAVGAPESLDAPESQESSEEFGLSNECAVKAGSLSAACAETNGGTQPIIAAALGASVAPEVSLDEAYGVHLAQDGSSRSGVVSFRAVQTGDYVVYAGTAALAVTLRGDEGPLVPSCSAGLAANDCKELRRGSIYHLQEGKTYRVELGPSSTYRWVRLVVEPLTDTRRVCTSAELGLSQRACDIATQTAGQSVTAPALASTQGATVETDVAYNVGLTPHAGSNEGALSFTPRADGVYEVYLGTPNIPFAINGGPVKVLSNCTSTISAAECTGLRRGTAYYLRGGFEYRIALGPIAPARYVRLVIESSTAGVPVLTLDFPSPGVTSASSVVARGRALQAPGVPAAEVVVNGIAASIDAAGSWSANVPLAPGDNTLTVRTVTSNGADNLETSAHVQREPLWWAPRDLDYDPTAKTVYFIAGTQSATDSIIAADATTHLTRLIAGPAQGLGQLSYVTRDTEAHRLFVASRSPDGILAIDSDTGATTTISDATHGSGPDLRWPHGMELDAPNHRLIVSDFLQEYSAEGRLLAVDLLTGDRTVIAEVANPVFGVDSANHRALTGSYAALSWIDLSTGATTPLTELASGIGQNDLYVQLDAEHGRVFAEQFFSEPAYVLVSTFDLSTGAEPTYQYYYRSPSNRSPTYWAGAYYDGSENRLLLSNYGQPKISSLDLATLSTASVAEAALGTGIQLEVPSSAVFDAARNRALYLDGADVSGEADYQYSLSTESLETGERAYGQDLQFGTDLFQPDALVLNGTGGVAYVGNGDGVWALDLVTNADTLVSGTYLLRGAGEPLQSVSGLALEGSRILVVDTQAKSVVAIDLASGDRSVLADGFNTPTGIALDLGGHHAFVTDAGNKALVSIDLSTGAPTVISSATQGTGPLLVNPRAIATSSEPARAYVVDTGLDAVIAVDLATGDRTIISSATVGLGDPFDRKFDANAGGPVGISLDEARRRALVTVRAVGEVGLFWVDLTNGQRLRL